MSEVIIHNRFGELKTLWNGSILDRIVFGRYSEREHKVGEVPPFARDVAGGLEAYLDGDRHVLKPFERIPEGSAFQMNVWRTTLVVPYGETVSYGEIAERIGQDVTASRAVGMALNKNPLPLIVPCHRVVGSSGDLTGFRGGLAWKRALLGLEMPQLSLVL